MSEIRDITLAPEGEKKIRWVEAHMPVLKSICEDFEKTQPFKGLKVTVSVHLEAKTGYLACVMKAGGADVYVTGSNVLSTQDDICAAMVKRGIEIFAWHGATEEEYAHHLDEVLKIGPQIIIDDGGDLVNMIHHRYPELIPNVIGGCEETTTGIIRDVAMDKAGELKFPMMMVNDAAMKHLFDNRYGTGQSAFDGINRTTNLVVAGKTVVVAGYGWCGKGVAMRAKGLGANVIVTEIDPVKAIEALMDGFRVMPMAEAAPLGDLFITVTGMRDVITMEHMLMMKDGTLLSNAGHFNVEVDVAALEREAVKKEEQRHNIMGYTLKNGKTLSLLGEGRLVNLACGDGHPAEIMDMSFAVQALSAEYLVKHKDDHLPMINQVPEEIDNEIARRKLASMNVGIDTLTEVQEQYRNSFDL